MKRMDLYGISGIGFSPEDQEVTVTAWLMRTDGKRDDSPVQITWDLGDADREDLHTLALAIYKILTSRVAAKLRQRP